MNTLPTPFQLDITPLDAPVPPMLEAAIGYAGAARLVAFHWQPAGDEACYDDGQTSLCGAHWPAYLAYTQHPAVWPHLALYDFGSSEEPARHWLLLDRATRQLYAAPWDVAGAALRLQARPAGEEQTPRELPTADELLALLSQTPYRDPTQIAAQIAEAEQARQELVAWLDDYAERQEEH
jgi:hypothetical protein